MVFLFALAGALAGAISWLAGQSQNFDVFTAASHALFSGRDLYALDAADYFKYSPTFALLFAPLTWLPPWLGAISWGALNFGVCGYALPRNARWLALLGILVATDGDQSNLLVTGLSLLALAAWEKGQLRVFAHLVAAATLVKLFPIALASLVLLSKDRRKAGGEMVIALAMWTLLPLAVLTPSALLAQYHSWLALLARDHGNQGWSVMTLLGGSSLAVQVLGICVQCAPIVLAAHFRVPIARPLVASLLVFSVLFNHRAEYATYVVAAVGLAISEVPRRWRPLVILALLAPGPFFARPEPGTHGVLAFLAAHRLYHPLRVLPLLLLWVGMQGQLLARFVEVRIRVRRHA